MNISYRIANTDDAPIITDLSRQLGYESDELVTKEYLKLLATKNNNLTLLILVNDIVVGWIQVCDMVRLESGRFCEVVGLVIDEKYRGSGLGKLLIEQAKTWAVARCCTKLKVRTNTKRIPTHKFYESIGFAEVKEQKVYEMIV